MPRSYYRAGYYRGPQSVQDPLAAAIGSAFDAFEERAEEKRQRERQEQLDRERQEDRASEKADRESRRAMEDADRRFRYAQQGFVERDTPRTAAVPGLVPSFDVPGKAFQKVMPSATERQATLEDAIRQRREQDLQRQQEARDRAALEAVADVMKRPDLKDLPLPQLKAQIDALQAEEKVKRERETITHREREQARFLKPAGPPSENAKEAYTDKITMALGYAPFVEKEAALSDTDIAEARRLGITMTDWKAAHARARERAARNAEREVYAAIADRIRSGRTP